MSARSVSNVTTTASCGREFASRFALLSGYPLQGIVTWVATQLKSDPDTKTIEQVLDFFDAVGVSKSLVQSTIEHLTTLQSNFRTIGIGDTDINTILDDYISSFNIDQNRALFNKKLLLKSKIITGCCIGTVCELLNTPPLVLKCHDVSEEELELIFNAIKYKLRDKKCNIEIKDISDIGYSFQPLGIYVTWIDEQSETNT